MKGACGQGPEGTRSVGALSPHRDDTGMSCLGCRARGALGTSASFQALLNTSACNPEGAHAKQPCTRTQKVTAIISFVEKQFPLPFPFPPPPPEVIIKKKNTHVPSLQPRPFSAASALPLCKSQRHLARSLTEPERAVCAEREHRRGTETHSKVSRASCSPPTTSGLAQRAPHHRGIRARRVGQRSRQTARLRGRRAEEHQPGHLPASSASKGGGGSVTRGCRVGTDAVPRTPRSRRSLHLRAPHAQ